MENALLWKTRCQGDASFFGQRGFVQRREVRMIQHRFGRNTLGGVVDERLLEEIDATLI